MCKHAYLIVAYNNWEILKKQLMLLDYKYNDIYLLVDKKSLDFKMTFLPKLEHSNIYMMERMDIYWADYSQVNAMITMMKKAFENEVKFMVNYKYFHFFSGTCLPLKSQEYIHRFCDENNKEFIAIVPKEYWYCTKRVKFFWPFINTKYYKPHKLIKGLVYGFAEIQRLFRVNRLKDYKGKVYNGWDWASITHDFAEYLLVNERFIFNMFNKTLCPSELWLHTLAYNSEFKDKLYNIDDLRLGSMRYIDWDRGRPYTWGKNEDDYKTLMESPYLFARKFDQAYMEIVDKIYEELRRIS